MDTTFSARQSATANRGLNNLKLTDTPYPNTVENEIRDSFYELRLLLNNGRYQMTVYTVAPSASTDGQAGESRFVIEGADARIYMHDGTNWWKSPYAWTQIT